MDRMLVVVFDAEAKAYEGRNTLLALDNEGSIVVYAYAVISRSADGTTIVKQTDDQGPFRTLVGTAVGSLLGVIGGPAGVALGAYAGLLAGGAADLHNARVGDDFVDDVTKKLTPNKYAVVAEIKEDWTTPVDTRMEALGGVVFRRALSEVKHVVKDEDTAAMQADLAELKAEHAQAAANRKGKLQEKINELDSKIQARLQKAKEHRAATEAQAKAKAEIAKNKAASLKAKAAQTNI